MKYVPDPFNNQGSDLVSELASRVLKGDHRALAKAISIVESAGLARRRLIHELYPVDKAIQEFRKRGRKVGVLAIDPSSPFTGGAILGDRIRMMDHSLEREVYIRSMASRGDVGGLARAAINTIRVLDAAGMDVVIVETVGAGQTEVQVATAVDATVVVLMPQLGDEVQAFKAGFNEIGDIFVVNKADITNPSKTMFNVASGLQEKNGWRPPVLKTVAIKGIGVPSLVDSIEKFQKFLEDHGMREERAKKRLESELIEAAFSDFYTETVARLKRERSWQRLLGQVAKKELDPETAASRLVKAIARLDVSANA